jgi:hypothetical protein
MTKPIVEYSFTVHCRQEMERRGLTQEQVCSVLAAPEQRETVRPGRDVLQSKIRFADGVYLLRVFVDVDSLPARVVTAYRTGKIAKYWRADQ